MSSVTNSICRSCRLSRTSSVAARTFASSATRGIIPPESPNYVDIPDTYQTDFYPPRRQKGILPVPREIFPARQPDKPSQQYLSRAIPPQKASTKSPTRITEQDKFKARMTSLRRQHLRSGLLELYNRKLVTTGQMSEKSTRRQNERSRLMTQPPREDERLTSTSIPSSMRVAPGKSSTLLNDPTTASTLHALKTTNFQTQVANKSSTRLDALHTLYMHARSFITTEKQLSAEIDRAFDHPAEEWGTAVSTGDNVWNREPPVTIATLFRENTAAGNGGGERGELPGHRSETQRYRNDQRRMKRLAEVLSGGKM